MESHDTHRVPQTDCGDAEISQLITDLKQRSRKQLKCLFRSLPHPSIEEFDGEYEGILLNQGSWLTSRMTRFFVNKEGFWLGKAFQPMSPDLGRGYNIFRTRRGVRRSLRMHLRLRDSDSGENRVLIEYAGINDGLVGTITDELRRLAPGLFLGIGTVPLGGRFFPQLYRKVMFAMVGPVAKFREDAAEADIMSPDEQFTGVAA